jgi:DNA-binding response OmpR family regulator
MSEKKILIVDDSPEMRMLMERILMREGYSVIPASDGNQCLDALNNNPDIVLIFLDLMMPNFSGFEVLEKLIALRETRPELKVAVVSGLKDKGDILRSLKLKADDYILKPIDPQIVAAKARILLGDANAGNEFVWLEKHLPCELIENIIMLRFTLIHLSENRCVFESDVPFVTGLPFAFKCARLAELTQIEGLELRARVDACEPLSQTGGRHRIFCTFIGNPEATMQKIRLFTQKNARKSGGKSL